MQIVNLERIFGSSGIGDERFKYLNLWCLTYIKNSHRRFWTFASRNNPPDLLSPPKANAVAIVPQVQTPDGWALIVTKEFRVTINGYQYGFPAGLIEAGQTLEEAATVELKQETGLSLVAIARVSPLLLSSAGLTDEAMKILIVEATGELSRAHLEPNEDIDAFAMSPQQVRMLCDGEGEFKDAMIDGRAWGIMNQFAQTGNLL